MKQNLCKICH